MPEIEITEAKLHYAVSGKGEPILLIPGLGMDHTYYRLGAINVRKHHCRASQDARQ
jgi:hypothetical protein